MDDTVFDDVPVGVKQALIQRLIAASKSELFTLKIQRRAAEIMSDESALKQIEAEQKRQAGYLAAYEEQLAEIK